MSILKTFMNKILIKTKFNNYVIKIVRDNFSVDQLLLTGVTQWRIYPNRWGGVSRKNL